MNTFADRVPEKGPRSRIHEERSNGGETAPHFAYNRPESVAQRRLQDLVNDSPQVSRLRALQGMADNRARVQQLPQLQTTADSRRVLQRVRIGPFDTQNDRDRAGIEDSLRNMRKDDLVPIYSDIQIENGRNAPYYLEFIRSLWVDRQIDSTPYRRDKVNIVVSIWINGKSVYQTPAWLSGYQSEFEEEFPFKSLEPNPYQVPDQSNESTVSQSDAETKAFLDAEDALKSILAIYGVEVKTIEFVITGNKGACDGCKMRRALLEERSREIAHEYPSAKNAVVSSREIYDEKRLGVERNSRKYGVSSQTTYGRKEDLQYRSETQPKLRMFSDCPLPRPSRQEFGIGDKVSDMVIPSAPRVHFMDVPPDRLQELIRGQRVLYFANSNQAFQAFMRGKVVLEQQFVMPADTPEGYSIFRIVQDPGNPRMFHIARCLRGG